MQFDLLIKGGEVIDPAGGLRGRLDVGIIGNRIAAVGSNFHSSGAIRVLAADGLYVTPGLIDLHAHVFVGFGCFGVNASIFGSRTGVTTWVDAGSPGAFNLRGFREYIIGPAAVRVLTWMNLSYMGIAGLNYDEYANIESCNIPLFERVSSLNRDIVIGIKVRMGTGRVGNPGIEPLRRAREAADLTGLPIMVHISTAPPALGEVLKLLAPGDVVTHAVTGQSMRIVDDNGRVRDDVIDARKRGIVFDVGHGSGSFSFTTAEALAAEGFWPDVLSTDLHAISMHGHNVVKPPVATGGIAEVSGDGAPAFSMLTVLTKFLHLGMPIEEVIRACTSRPAAILRLDGQIGTLRPGAFADVALLRLSNGNFPLYDTDRIVRASGKSFECISTVANGKILDPAPWPPVPDHVRLISVDKDLSRLNV